MVEYNIQDQIRALRGIAAWYQSLRQNRAAPAAQKRESETSSAESWTLELEWRWFLAVVLPFLFTVAWLRWRRARRGRSAPQQRLDSDQERALRLYVALEKDLRKAGHPRPSDLTPKEHAIGLVELGFEAADEVQELTEAYLGTRFGSSPLPASEYQRLRSLGRRVRDAGPSLNS